MGGRVSRGKHKEMHMAANRKFTGFAKRLQNAGLRVWRSDRSETIYVAIGKCELRISGHELGVADYGTRQQKHHGPEVVTALEDLGSAVEACLLAVREYLFEDCRAAHWEGYERSSAAKAICALRRLKRKCL